MFSRIKQFLKKSGVKYTIAFGRPEQGQEMIDEINPLSVLIEHPEYPMARIYNESFWQGITYGLFYTYHILVGDHFDLYITGKGRKGVLDLLIFPLIGRVLVAIAADRQRSWLLRPPAGFIGLALEIPRGLIGIALTLAFFPLVVLVQFFSGFKARDYNKASDELEIISKEERLGGEPGNELKEEVQAKATLASLGPRNATSIQPVYKSIFVQPSAEDKQNYLKTERLSHLKTETSIKLPTGAWKEIEHTIELKKKNRQGIKALLELNRGDILDHLKEKEGALEEIEQWIKKPPEQAAREAVLMGTVNRAGEEPSALHKFAHDPMFDKNLFNKIFDWAEIPVDDWCDKTDESDAENEARARLS